MLSGPLGDGTKACYLIICFGTCLFSLIVQTHLFTAVALTVICYAIVLSYSRQLRVIHRTPPSYVVATLGQVTTASESILFAFRIILLGISATFSYM